MFDKFGNLYAIVPFSADEPWIHSTLYDMPQGWVGEYSRFLLYDPALRNQEKITLQLYACADDQAGTLALSTNDGQYQTFSLGRTMTWVEASITVEQHEGPLVIWLTAPEGTVYVETYLVQ